MLIAKKIDYPVIFKLITAQRRTQADRSRVPQSVKELVGFAGPGCHIGNQEVGRCRTRDEPGESITHTLHTGEKNMQAWIYSLKLSNRSSKEG